MALYQCFREVHNRQKRERVSVSSVLVRHRAAYNFRLKSILSSPVLATMIDAPRIKTSSKFKVKHQKRKLFRANEPFFSVFMWGVNFSASELSNVNMPVMLLPDDFKAYMKLLELWLFASSSKILRSSHIDRIIFLDGEPKLSSPGSIENTTDERMWLSADRLFFVRTVTSDDVANLHYIFAELHRHYIETEAATLLPKLLGLFRLSVEDRYSYLLVLKNIFSPQFPVHEIYGIKGSTVDRFASLRERHLEPPEYKDNDLLNRKRLIHVGPEMKRQLLERLRRDAQVLAKLNIMDYSLIIGIHRVDQHHQQSRREQTSEFTFSDDENEEEPANIAPELEQEEDEDDLEEEGGGGGDEREYRTSQLAVGIPSVPSSPQRELYFVGISKMFTFYGTRKKTAHLAKTAKYGAEAEISSVKPDQYAKRLIDFVDRILI